MRRFLVFSVCFVGLDDTIQIVDYWLNGNGSYSHRNVKPPRDYDPYVVDLCNVVYNGEHSDTDISEIVAIINKNFKNMFH